MSNFNKKKLWYSILLEIDKGENVPTHFDFDISKNDYINVIKILENEGLLKGSIPDLQQGVRLDEAYITLKGDEFLDANNPLKKTYRGLKEAREWIRL